MKPTAQRCLDAIASPVKRLWSGKSAGKIQRKHRRYPLTLPGTYAVCGAAMAQGTCELIDISAGGMALRMAADQGVGPQEVLRVSVALPAWTDPVAASVHVRWAVAEEPGACRAGGICVCDDSRAHKELLEYAYTGWFRRTI